jgi:hypothetical protein
MRLKPRLTDLPAEDRQLVAKHENLELLPTIAAGEEHDQLQQPANEDVERRHKQRRPPAERGHRRYRDQLGLRASPARVLAPHGLANDRPFDVLRGL